MYLQEQLIAVLSITKGVPAMEIEADASPVCHSPPAALDQFQFQTSKTFQDDPSYVKGSSLMSKDEVVCEFFHGFFWWHVPHSMEMLYPCISLWRAFPDRKPVLYVNLKPNLRNRMAAMGQEAFLPSMIRAFQDIMGVEIRYSPSSPSIAFTRERDDYQPYYFEHADDFAFFRSAVLEHYFPSKPRLVCPDKVRVGILDRQGTRGLLNVDEVRAAIAETLGDNVDTITHHFFENATFLAQVDYMADVDLLVTPHGAQQSSIPFLSPCATIIEIFVPNYYVANFFGSLAKASGHDLYSIFVGDGQPEISNHYDVNATAQKVCAPIPTLKEGLMRMLDDYRACCRSLVAGSN